ncbi:hypothetical protein ACFLS0_00110 [Candidatus Bipolaricaulota bacterium]
MTDNSVAISDWKIALEREGLIVEVGCWQQPWRRSRASKPKAKAKKLLVM